MRKPTYTIYCDACAAVIIPELAKPDRPHLRMDADTPGGDARLDFCSYQCRNTWIDQHKRITE